MRDKAQDGVRGSGQDLQRLVSSSSQIPNSDGLVVGSAQKDFLLTSFIIFPSLKNVRLWAEGQCIHLPVMARELAHHLKAYGEAWLSGLAGRDVPL